MTGAELKRMLTKGGHLRRGKGSRLKGFLKGKQSVISMHKGDMPTGTLNAISKQLGLR